MELEPTQARRGRSLRTSDGDGHGVAEALGRLCDIAALRQPDDPLLVRFLPLYYSELPADDVDDRKLDDVYAVAVAHLALGRVRAPGEPVARVLSPDRERDGWHSQHSVAARRHRRHAVPRRHDADGARTPRPRRPPARPPDAARSSATTAHRLVDVAPDVGRRRRGVIEAWTQIEIDRTDEATAGARRGRRSSRPSTTCSRVVDDFPAMRDRMEALGDVDPILPWLADGQFVFLGAADYDVAADGALTLRAGQRARPGPRRRPRLATPRPMPAGRSGRHRPHRRHVDGVPGRAPDGRRRRPAGRRACRRRFVGLLATNAYRVSVLDIPGVGAAVADALDLDRGADALAHRAGHAHRAREPAPRPRARARADGRWPGSWPPSSGSRSASSCGCSRCPSRSGRGSTVLVYLPRNRFTAELPERVADAVAAAYGADRRTFEPHLGASSLARIAVSVRRPDGAAPVDLDALERADRRAVDVVGGPAAGGARRRRRRGARAADAVRRASARTRPPAYRGGRAAGAGRSATSAASPTLLAERRRADHVARPRRRRAAGGVALPRLPAGRAGGAVRAAAAARPPRPAGARRAAVHVPRRRRAGLRLRHRRPRRRPTSTSTSRAAGRAAGRVRRARRRRRRERRLQPPRPARRADAPARSRSCGPTASTCARSGSPSARRTSRTTLAGHPRARRRPRRAVPRPLRPGPVDGGTRDAARRPRPRSRERVVGALDAIPSLDDDRICRAFLTLIDATVRTNYYRDRPADRRSSSTRRRSPSCRCRGRSTRSGCAGRGSRACTCAAATSPAAGCAGATAGRTSAPRSSA